MQVNQWYLIDEITVHAGSRQPPALRRTSPGCMGERRVVREKLNVVLGLHCLVLPISPTPCGTYPEILHLDAPIVRGPRRQARFQPVARHRNGRFRFQRPGAVRCGGSEEERERSTEQRECRQDRAGGP